MDEKKLTAAEWLRAREELATRIRAAHSRMEMATAVKIAEALLLDGVVIIDALYSCAEDPTDLDVPGVEF